jgi:hypothetical protein
MYNNTLPTGMTGSTLLRNRCAHANAAEMCAHDGSCGGGYGLWAVDTIKSCLPYQPHPASLQVHPLLWQRV